VLVLVNPRSRCWDLGCLLCLPLLTRCVGRKTDLRSGQKVTRRIGRPCVSNNHSDDAFAVVVMISVTYHASTAVCIGSGTVQSRCFHLPHNIRTNEETPTLLTVLQSGPTLFHDVVSQTALKLQPSNQKGTNIKFICKFIQKRS
jgi:hypothetical protein